MKKKKIFKPKSQLLTQKFLFLIFYLFFGGVYIRYLHKQDDKMRYDKIEKDMIITGFVKKKSKIQIVDK